MVKRMQQYSDRPVLVTGGSGFVGAWVVRILREQGRSVRVLDIVPSTEPEIDMIIGDLRDPVTVWNACEGVETVFHTASLIDWGVSAKERLFDVNIQGTRWLLAACWAHNVARFIYTSSIDVVFDGTPICGGDERLPYASKFLDDYGESKAIAEQAVLAAHGRGGLATCALRLGGVYGPGDQHRFPAIFATAQRGAVPRLGHGRAKFSHVYVENAAYAHIQAEQALTLAGPPGGQAYFITDQEIKNFFHFFEPYLQAFGYRLTSYILPEQLIYPIATILEAIYRWRSVPHAPFLTRYIVASTCRDFWFTSERARRDFGYQPIINAATAQARTIEWLKTVLRGTK